MVGLLTTTVRRLLKKAHLDRPRWSYACRFAGHMMREKELCRPWKWPLFGQLDGIWKIHNKDVVVIKGLCPQPLDPARYHINPKSELTDLEKRMPWRSVQDEFAKLKRFDHEGRTFHGTPNAVEPDPSHKT